MHSLESDNIELILHKGRAYITIFLEVFLSSSSVKVVGGLHSFPQGLNTCSDNHYKKQLSGIKNIPSQGSSLLLDGISAIQKD